MGRQSIVLLHGWQSKISHWQPLIKILRQKYEVYCPCLPGFGQDKLARTWTLDDYCQWLRDYLLSQKISDPILLGHSFGGRIAIKFVTKHKVKKLILIASAGIKTHKKFKKIIFLILAKAGRSFFSIWPFLLFKNMARWFLYTLAREKDYYYAEGFLKSTMRKIIGEDLESLLTKIEVPTLILWGVEDTSTPPRDAEIMNQKIKDSHLVIFENAGHNLPFTQTEKISDLIFNFCQ